MTRSDIRDQVTGAGGRSQPLPPVAATPEADMTQQVVTITPQGGISGLQHKTGKGLDLRQFGHACIERVSEIVWYEEHQRWRVRLIAGPMADHILTTGMTRAAGVSEPIEGAMAYHYRGFDVLEFEDYDDAVAAEVLYLDALRVRGTF